jgi:hypothetical protein
MGYPTAGAESAGSPTGEGSGFAVRRALAVGGQLVRVVFSCEPKHASTAGLDDARNAANFEVRITLGSGKPAQSVAVKPTVVPYPAFGVVRAGEVGCDLQLDRPLIVGMVYEVAVSPAVRSKNGQAIGSPYAATFKGASRPVRTRHLRRKVGLVDLASDPFIGGISVDSSGDWSSHEGLDSTKKRVWRIVLTSRGGFSWLQDFGLKHDVKKPATLSVLTDLRTDIRQQLAKQPDIVFSESRVTLDARGLMYLTVRGRTKSGEPFDNTVRATGDGRITL